MEARKRPMVSYIIFLITESGHKLYDSDEDGGQAGIQHVLSAHVGEDGNGVEDDGVDSTPLLEEHQAHGEEERQQDGTLKQRTEGRQRMFTLLLLVFSLPLQVVLDRIELVTMMASISEHAKRQFLPYILVLPSPQPAERLLGLVLLLVGH